MNRQIKNTFFQAVELIKTQLENDPDVNTISFNIRSQADLYKKNIYPIAVINPIDRPDLITVQTASYTFEVGVFDQVDLSTDDVLDKFYGNDNNYDILGTTDEIISRLTKYLVGQYNDYGIEVTSITNPVPTTYGDKNILSGWYFQITLEVPNTNLSSC